MAVEPVQPNTALVVLGSSLCKECYSEHVLDGCPAGGKVDHVADNLQGEVRFQCRNVADVRGDPMAMFGNFPHELLRVILADWLPVDAVSLCRTPAACGSL